MKKFLQPILIISILLIATLAIIAYGRGYRFSLQKRTLSSTGLLSASSEPTGAEVFINGKLMTATNATLTLPPEWYEVKIVKDGFLPWEKKIRLKGEIVSETQAYLFPSTPTLVPLTTNGITSPQLSPNGTKIIYATQKGLWVLNLSSSPLGFSRDPQFLTPTTPLLDLSLATFFFSPDSTQIVAQTETDYFLIDQTDSHLPVLLSPLAFEDLQKEWENERKLKEAEKLAVFPKKFVNIATTSARILAFSPDETKVLYQATASATLPVILKSPPPATNPTPEDREIKQDQIYVYDIKEDKNYLLDNKYQLPDTNLSWFPTSRHLVISQKDKISVMEYDGANNAAIYSGPLDKFVGAVPSGKKLIILASYNNSPNLYSINLR